jgi:hypothetical protein
MWYFWSRHRLRPAGSGEGFWRSCSTGRLPKSRRAGVVVVVASVVASMSLTTVASVVWNAAPAAAFSFPAPDFSKLPLSSEFPQAATVNDVSTMPRLAEKPSGAFAGIGLKGNGNDGQTWYDCGGPCTVNASFGLAWFPSGDTTITANFRTTWPGYFRINIKDLNDPITLSHRGVLNYNSPLGTDPNDSKYFLATLTNWVFHFDPGRVVQGPG